MCGRYGLIAKKNEIIKRFEVENTDFDFKENFNIAPSLKMPVVERHSPNSIHLRKWGILASDRYFTINARTDKLERFFLWKKAIQQSRIIIPADYFFEWKREGNNKQPYLFRLKNKQMFGFAGLLIDYKDKENKDQTGFVILTTEANSIMRPVHDRLPCILKKEDEEEWLNPDNVELEQLMKYLNPYPSVNMEAFPVSQIVNSPKNNSKEILSSIK